MTKTNIIRAWKDEEYRRSLSEAERAMLPDNPAGVMELSDAELGLVAGGTEAELARTGSGWTLGCCSTIWRECGFSWYLGTYGCCPVSSDMQCYMYMQSQY
ncbi:MAG TPA: mersacidin/lichenicidin family type 2 lantibiotic [Pyrinomonadaceae bacterium]|nr:mersacidin/lichenicidin family type 2 lantibiotic [Pyrinomonadaceae bacterium]